MDFLEHWRFCNFAFFLNWGLGNIGRFVIWHFVIGRIAAFGILLHRAFCNWAFCFWAFCYWVFCTHSCWSNAVKRWIASFTTFMYLKMKQKLSIILLVPCLLCRCLPSVDCLLGFLKKFFLKLFSWPSFYAESYFKSY